MAQRLDGRVLAGEIRQNLAERVARMAPIVPGLLLIRVGEDPASQLYVRNKEKAAREAGIDSRVQVLPEETAESDLLARIADANHDPAVHGILVQLPLPAHIRSEAAAEAVDPAKDVDGLHPYNQGRLAFGRPAVIPCTPLGILALLRRNAITLRGARVTVLGRSAIVGRPVASLLSLKASWADATVTLCHSRSRDWPQLTRESDIVIAAMGQARVVTGAMIRSGAAVVDVGQHRVADPERPGSSRVIGDVDAESVEPVAGWLTPVPGGVGPLTVAMLLANTVEAAERACGRPALPIWEALPPPSAAPSGPGENAR
jgi:methylenetetrahydrofolate dehydrogenase (NADP+) / methenyltetrahydrofolate cyclohydrolase